MRKKIFVIEDDEAIRESLTELLESEGFLVSSAENGQVALDVLGRSSALPNLILLDLMMPIKDGAQFCVEQAASKKLADIPVVIMSAIGTHESGGKIGNGRAKAYLRKPADIDVIVKTVRHWCS